MKLTDEMVVELRKTIFMTRGPAAKRKEGKTQHPLYKENPEWQDSGHRTFLRLPELTGRIWLHFKEYFAAEAEAGREVTLNQLYHRVRRWCKRHDIVYRMANETKEADKELIARRCLGTLLQVHEVMTRHGFGPEAVCNLDETGLRLFALEVQTLHYKGEGSVPVDSELRNKLTLSCPVLWYGSGWMDIVVVWYKPKSTLKTYQWSKEGDIWFLETPSSKNTTKKTYCEIIRHFRSMNPEQSFREFTDDVAGGHGGLNPDHMVKQFTPSANRTRVQGLCTPFLNAADQVWTNKQLKTDIRDRLRIDHIETLLNGDPLSYHKGLTKACRKYIGELLTEIKTLWNTSDARKEGIRKAFRQTICTLQSGECISRLAKLLAEAEEKGWTPIYNPYGSDPSHPIECPHGCEMRFKDEKAFARHTEADCWPRRPHFQPPKLPNQDPNEAPKGILFCSNQKWAVVVDKDVAYRLDTNTRLPPGFWKLAEWSDPTFYQEQLEGNDFLYNSYAEQIGLARKTHQHELDLIEQEKVMLKKRERQLKNRAR